MAEYFRNEDTGQLYAKLPGDRWMEIQPEDVDVLEEGGVEAFVNAAGNSVGQLATGVPTMLGIDEAEQSYRALQDAQRLRGEVNTAAGGAGFLAPDVLAGAFTGGTGTIARRAATTGLVEAGIGAARNPDDPFTGAAIGGALGGAGGAAAGLLAGAPLRGLTRVEQLAPDAPMAARVSARIADNADDVRATVREVGGPGSILGTSTDDMAMAGQRGFTARIAGMFEGNPPSPETLAEAQRLGLKLTPADLKGSAAQKNVESALRRNPTAQAVFDSEIMRPNQQTLNQLAGRAAGFADDTTDGITPEMMGANVDRISEGFSDQAAKIGTVDLDTDAIRKAAMAGSDTMVPDVEAAVRAVLDKMPKKVNGETGLDYLHRMRDSAAGQWRAGNAQVAQALEDIADAVEEQMIAAAPKDVASSLKALRTQWKAQRLLERTGVLTEEGDVAFGSLRQSMRTDKHLSKAYRRARGMGSKEFDDLASATRVLAQFRERIGNSGTPTGQMDFLDPRTYLGYPLAKGYLHGGNVGGAAGGAAGGYGLYEGGSALLGE